MEPDENINDYSFNDWINSMDKTDSYDEEVIDSSGPSPMEDLSSIAVISFSNFYSFFFLKKTFLSLEFY